MYYSVKSVLEKYVDVIFYVNITNGIESLQTLKALDIEPRFVNIQSTRLEQCDYNSVIKELGADLLMNLAVGKVCCIIDYGANKKNSKAVYKGVPLIKYICERAWYGESKRPAILKRNSDDVKLYCEDEFDAIYNNLDRSTRRILQKYSSYANSDSVNIVGVSESTTHDGDKEFYKRVASKFI